MKDYDKSRESLYIQYWDVNNLYGWAMSQKLPVNNFERIKDTSQFNEELIKNYNGVFSIQKFYIIFIIVYHFYHKE